MKPCLSEATTLPASFTDDLDAYAAAGWRGMEVWFTKLETCLNEHPAGELRQRIQDKQIKLAAASYQGGLLLSQGEQRRTHYEHFKRRLDLCQYFGIGTMVVVADFAQKVDTAGLERTVVSLRQACQWAAGSGVTLALEFRGADTFCSSLDTAVRLIEHCGETNAGICLDVFHFYKGPSKFEDLELLTKANLAFVQLADVAGVPRELMTDADRILPGEGDFRLAAILKKLHAIGYDGWVSLEMMNPHVWHGPASQVAELGLAAMKRMMQGYTS
jgi:2-keto-myo-inositol isomerase